MTLRENMEQHILLLCLMFGISWNQDTPMRAAEVSQDGGIKSPPIHGQRQYFTALHEIAHCLHHTSYNKPRIEQEAEAWLWALDQAIVKPSPGTVADIADVMRGYVLWAACDGRAIPASADGLVPVLRDRLMEWVPTLVVF